MTTDEVRADKRIRELDWYIPEIVPISARPDTPVWRDFLASEPIVERYGRWLRKLARIPAEAVGLLRVATDPDLCDRHFAKSHADPDHRPFLPQPDDMEILLVPVGRLDAALSGDALTEARLERIHRAVLALGRARGWRLSGVHAAAARTRADLGLPGGDPEAEADPAEPWPDPPQVSDEFWEWIDTLGGTADDAGVHTLADRLRTAGSEAVEQFETDLLLAMQKLSTPRHARSVRRLGIEEYGEGFDYVRAAVIAAGRVEFQRVIDDPKSLTAFVDERPMMDGSRLWCLPAIITGDIP